MLQIRDFVFFLSQSFFRLLQIRSVLFVLSFDKVDGLLKLAVCGFVGSKLLLERLDQVLGSQVDLRGARLALDSVFVNLAQFLGKLLKKNVL